MVLASEAFAEPAFNDPNGDRTVKPGVFGAIHLAHATCAKRREDLVRSQPSSGSQGHGVSNNSTVRERDIQDRAWIAGKPEVTGGPCEHHRPVT